MLTALPEWAQDLRAGRHCGSGRIPGSDVLSSPLAHARADRPRRQPGSRQATAARARFWPLAMG